MMFKSTPITVLLKRFISDVHLLEFDSKRCNNIFILAKSSEDNKAPVFIDTVPYERRINTGVRLRKVQVTVTKYQ